MVCNALFGSALIISMFVATSSDRKKLIVELSFIGAGGQNPVFVQNLGKYFLNVGTPIYKSAESIVFINIIIQKMILLVIFIFIFIFLSAKAPKAYKMI